MSHLSRNVKVLTDLVIAEQLKSNRYVIIILAP